MIRHLILLVTCIAFIACTNPYEDMLIPNESDFHEGDIVFRRGKGLNSEAVMYVDDEKAVVGAICRPYDNSICKESAKYAIELYDKKILFDHDYDSSDTTKFYCTELLMFIYYKCGQKLVDTDGHDVNFPFIKHKVFLPSDIYSSKQLKQIRNF